MHPFWVSITVWGVFLLGLVLGMLWRGNWDLQDRRGHGSRQEGIK